MKKYDKTRFFSWTFARVPRISKASLNYAKISRTKFTFFNLDLHCFRCCSAIVIKRPQCNLNITNRFFCEMCTQISTNINYGWSYKRKIHNFGTLKFLNNVRTFSASLDVFPETVTNAELKERLIGTVKREVKQVMEEAVTRRGVREDSGAVTALCAAVEACLGQGLRRRALGLFKTSSTTALLHKVAKVSVMFI